MTAPQILGLRHSVSGVFADLWRRAGGAWQHAFTAQPHPPQWLVFVSGGLALIVVVSAWTWPRARTVVTIVHEGGHVIVALLTGQRRIRVRLYRDTGGETLSTGTGGGIGVALTAAAGYPAPSLVGLGVLIALAIAVRNLYGMLAVIVTAGTVAAVCLYASPVVQAAFGYTMTWFLLLGGVRPVAELYRERRRHRSWRTDADQLARLTHLPGGAWVVIFGVFAVAALGLSARWLVG
jgi:hypothetical protein